MRGLPLAFGVLAAALALFASARGIGIGPDSVRYFAAAESIAHGDGVMDSVPKPLTHFPPAYPAVLAIPVALGAPEKPAARYVQAILFGLMLALVVRIAAGIGGLLAGAIAGALVLTAYAMPELGVWAWSEPLALCLALVGLALLEERWVVSAIAIGCAMLTRYAFGAFWLAGALLLIRRDPKRAVAWSAIAWLIVLPWIVRNLLVGRGPTDRALGWHPAPWRDLRIGFQVLGGWVDPYPITGAIAIAVGIAAFGCLLALALDARVRRYAFGGAVYLGCLWLARAIFDPATPFISRLIAPAGICYAIAAAPFLSRRRVLAACAALVIAINAVRTWRWAEASSRTELHADAHQVTTAK